MKTKWVIGYSPEESLLTSCWALTTRGFDWIPLSTPSCVLPFPLFFSMPGLVARTPIFLAGREKTLIFLCRFLAGKNNAGESNCITVLETGEISWSSQGNIFFWKLPRSTICFCHFKEKELRKITTS